MEKNEECEIVQDLLLGYSDRILNNKSKELVEKHLLECEKCQKKLDEINSDIKENETEQKKEIDYLKKVNKKISKKNKLIIIGTIFLTIIILLNVSVFINYSKVAGEIEIYLQDSINEQELSNIEHIIREKDKNAEIIYNSKQKALEKMKDILQDNGDLLSAYGDENNPLPASYVIKTKLSKVKEIVESTMTMPGVKTVISNIDDNPYQLFIASFFMKY